MKKILSILFVIGFFSTVFPVFSETIDPMNLPKLTEYVEDFSSTLSPSDLINLRKIAYEYEQNTTHQIAVVLIPNRNGNELFDIGMRIFNTNKIGQKDKDNGILLIIVTEEKKIRIITGYGLEGDIPDVLASDFIEKSIRPLVNEEKYTEAIRAFFQRTTQAIGTDEGKKLQEKNDTEGIWIVSIMSIIFGLTFSFNIFFLLFALFFFVVVSFSVGSIFPALFFIISACILVIIGFRYFNPGFEKNFFQIPKNNGGGGTNGTWGGGSSGGGGGFSGGGGSSGGGGAGD